jgi:CXXX repeat modification system protein
MRSLIVMLDRAAPSMCYYRVPAEMPAEPMPRQVFEAVLRHAEQRALTLHIVCGRDGVPSAARDLLADDDNHIFYLQPGTAGARPEDIIVVDAGESHRIESIEPGTHEVAILRVGPMELDRLASTWRSLKRRVYRVVVVLLDIEQYDIAKLDEYEAAMRVIEADLRTAYLEGEECELSTLSDRLLLTEGRHCDAGLDHLTVDPKGYLHICPGFAVDRREPIGRIGSDPEIVNRRLLTLENAPLCSICDAYHCRRCVHFHQRTTLELNTPPWQMCRVSHIEREASRRMLDHLQQKGILTQLSPIPKIAYCDPLERFFNPNLGGPAQRRENDESRQAERHKKPSKEKMMLNKVIGRVSPEERDQIRELHARKSGLSELFATLAKLDKESLDSSPLYDKLIADMGETSIEFQNWWDNMASKYQWKTQPGKKMRIDFDTCDIYLE